MNASVTSLLNAVTAGTGVPDGVFAEDAVLDATVPGWRLTRRGSDAIREQMSGWYADPGRFEDLERAPIPGGELVRFLLTWTEHGVPYAAHQSHIIEIAEDGRIARDWMFCGGRWDAGLLAQMEEADSVRA
jgi:hypothetical protein